MPVERTHKLTVLLSEDEWTMLEALADADLRNVSDYLRAHIANTYMSRSKEMKDRGEVFRSLAKKPGK